MKEIGSHFEFESEIMSKQSNSIHWLPLESYDYSYTFSGRSAIELILVDILQKQKIKRVYMPSYCCSSMISPFKKHQIDVIFYDIDLIENQMRYNIDLNEKVDIFFAMSYFGIENSLENTMQLFKQQGVIVIEDITHKLLCDITYSSYPDYYFASLRKWFPIPAGGIALKRNGYFQIKPYKESNFFVEKQVEAMKLKEEYSLGKKIEKHRFLDLYKELNKHINEIDYSYKIDSISLNILDKLNMELIKKKRKENGTYLMKRLNDLTIIQPLQSKVDFNNFTPLFIPVIINDGVRSELIQHLIAHGIYCPVHWPIPVEIAKQGKANDLYRKEISLICDQRYGLKEMQKIIDMIGEFEKKYV